MSDEAVNEQDLWVSENPRFGVVRAVVVDGEFAARFDDLNGDGREICLTLYQRDGVGWEQVASADDVAYPADGGATAPGWQGGLAYRVGRAEPGEVVHPQVAGDRSPIECDDLGWWLKVIPAEPSPQDFPSGGPIDEQSAGIWIVGVEQPRA